MALVGRAAPGIPYARLPMDLEGATRWGMSTGAAEQPGPPCRCLMGDERRRLSWEWIWPHDCGHIWEARSPHLSPKEVGLELVRQEALLSLTFRPPSP